MKNGKLKVVLIGLGFGGSFVPIWREHPDVYKFGIADLKPESTAYYAKEYPDIEVYKSIDDVLADKEVDAVHLVTPIPDHAKQVVRVLDSGKHCACTVPMATSLQEIRDIFAAVRRSGKKYMMMETTLYTYQYLYVKNMLDSGELGDIQLLRGSHYQDMEFWPEYWNGLPPFWYGTHAIAPMIGLSGSRIERVSCLGSGKMRKELMTRYGNPFPAETAHFQFANGLAAEATRTLFETARKYKEGLSVYGSKKSFEWGFCDNDDPIVTHFEGETTGRGKPTVHETVTVPNHPDSLPEVLRKFTVPTEYDATNPQKSKMLNSCAGHHGSHAYLIHEFVRSIIEDRKPYIDEELAANITAAGICAHESALRNGEWITIPKF